AAGVHASRGACAVARATARPDPGPRHRGVRSQHRQSGIAPATQDRTRLGQAATDQNGLGRRLSFCGQGGSTMVRWLPRGLAARVIGLTLLALLVSQAVSYFSFRHSSEDFVERMIGNYMGQTVAALDSSLQYVEPEYRSQMVRSLSRSRAEYKLQAQPPACRAPQSVEQRYARDLARRLNVKAQRVRVCIDAGSESDGHRRGRPEMLAVALQRSGGQWLVVEQNLPARSAHWAWRALRNLVITLVIMTVLVIVATYRFTRPLRDLAGAAERFGRGEKIEPLSVRGSDEIRRSIIEFNHMHERIERFVAGRTRLV